jgi:hypothetical protein
MSETYKAADVDPAAPAELARPSKPYGTCLTDAEWQIAQAFLPAPAPAEDRADD